MTAHRPGFEPLRGQGEQFRDGLQVPVGRLRVDVSEPGRQHRQPRWNIAAVAVEVGQGGDGEAMPQIVQPGPAPPRRDGDPGQIDQAGEGAREVVDVQAGAAGADEETRRAAVRAPPVTVLPIVPQRRHGRRMQEQPPRLAELRIQNNQRRGIEVDVIVVEAAGFALAHAGDGEQSDQRLPGRRPQRWAQPTGGVDERADLAGRIQMRRDPAPMVRQRVLGRDLAVGVQGLVVAGEDPYRHQPPRQIAVVAAAAASRCRPLQRQLAGDPVAADRLAVVDERHQLRCLGGQLEPQRPPHRQIVLGGASQLGHHRAPIGQGRASGRSAFSSTLA
jgi:hypothetical protein